MLKYKYCYNFVFLFHFCLVITVLIYLRINMNKWKWMSKIRRMTEKQWRLSGGNRNTKQGFHKEFVHGGTFKPCKRAKFLLEIIVSQKGLGPRAPSPEVFQKLLNSFVSQPSPTQLWRTNRQISTGCPTKHDSLWIVFNVVFHDTVLVI